MENVQSSKVIQPFFLPLIPGLQIYSPSYSSATSQLDFRQYQGLLRNPDLEPDSFRHESVSARRIYEFKSYRDGQVCFQRGFRSQSNVKIRVMCSNAR